MTPFNFSPPYDNTQVTLELRELVKSGVKVWDFEYPTYYNGEQKAAFEQKVLDHYWLRQIGMETPGRWLHYFRTRMREIMPYYIQLYESEALMRGIEDPFGNVDITETFEQEATGATTGETTGTSSTENSGTSSGTGTETRTNSVSQTSDKETDNTRKFSNTPQGSIYNLDSYMTEATVEAGSESISEDVDEDESRTKTDSATTSATSTGTASGTSTETTRGTVKHTFTKKGNQGVNTYAHDMKELRDTFLNIDLMVINELKDLFLQVY